MRKSILLGLTLALCVSTAMAQVNVVPQVGVITAVNTTKATYAAVALALPPAASATDIACIAGAAGKAIRINRIRITGTAGTLVTAPFTLVRRVAANTGGTAATTTANWANTISKLDSQSPAASAVLISYSANPTITDASPTYLRSEHLTVPVTSAGTVTQAVVWDFGRGFRDQPLTLRAAAEQVCVNLNAVSISTGLLHISTDWTEE